MVLRKRTILFVFFGEEKVVGVMCLEGATRLGPAEIQHTMSGITYVGELNVEVIVYNYVDFAIGFGVISGLILFFIMMIRIGICQCGII